MGRVNSEESHLDEGPPGCAGDKSVLSLHRVCASLTAESSVEQSFESKSEPTTTASSIGIIRTRYSLAGNINAGTMQLGSTSPSSARGLKLATGKHSFIRKDLNSLGRQSRWYLQHIGKSTMLGLSPSRNRKDCDDVPV